MDNAVWEVVNDMIVPIVVGIALALFNRKQNKRDEADRKAREARQKEIDERDHAKMLRDNLLLDMTMADADLSFAMAKAIKNGKANGELDAALVRYQSATEAYEKFIRNQAVTNLRKGAA